MYDSDKAHVRLKLPDADVASLAASIRERDWDAHREGKVDFHGRDWAGWCINGCEQMVRGNFVLGYHMASGYPNMYFPEVDEIVSAIPGKKHAVRLFMLAPSYVVDLHVDAGEFYLARDWREIRKIHVPIITDPLCSNFEDCTAGRREIHMRAGEYWFLNGTLLHGAVNRGVNERWHLVVDIDPSAELASLIC